MAFTPFKTRSTKQRLADTRLTIRRGPSVGLDTESRDPFSPMRAQKSKPLGPTKFSLKSPTFKAKRGQERPGFGRGY